MLELEQAKQEAYIVNSMYQVYEENPEYGYRKVSARINLVLECEEKTMVTDYQILKLSKLYFSKSRTLPFNYFSWLVKLKAAMNHRRFLAHRPDTTDGENPNSYVFRCGVREYRTPMGFALRDDSCLLRSEFLPTPVINRFVFNPQTLLNNRTKEIVDAHDHWKVKGGEKQEKEFEKILHERCKEVYI